MTARDGWSVTGELAAKPAVAETGLRSLGFDRHIHDIDATNAPVRPVAAAILSSQTPRADDADGAHEIGSRAVLLIAKYMLDAGAHLRAGNLNQPAKSGNRSI